MKDLKKYILTLSIIFFAHNLIYAQGCSEPSSDEGVTVWGYLQPEFNVNFEDEKQAAFEFRRMRIGVMGNIPYDFGYYVLMETSQFLNPNKNGPFLLDAFISYNRFKYAKIALGSFKYPFGAELGIGCHKLYTIRRSKIVDEMTTNYAANSNRDIGIMVLGGEATSFFSYQIALTNGNGIFVGEQKNNLFDTYALTGRAVFQPITGLRVAGSVRNGKLPSEAVDIEESDTRFRYGFDISYKTNKLFVSAEYLDGKDKGSYTTGGGCDGGLGQTVVGTKNTDGLYILGAYKFPFNLEPVYKFETFNSLKSGTTDGAAGTEESSICQTFGFNYYPNDWTRVQVNYVYASEDPQEVKNDALLVQLQVKF